MEFSDMVPLAVKLLKEHGDVLDAVHEQYTYCLCDEFQDTNK
jgi:superfamily I DNA/RNA helicase